MLSGSHESGIWGLRLRHEICYAQNIVGEEGETKEERREETLRMRGESSKGGADGYEIGKAEKEILIARGGRFWSESWKKVETHYKRVTRRL